MLISKLLSLLVAEGDLIVPLLLTLSLLSGLYARHR
jgi:hypothetical protein